MADAQTVMAAVTNPVATRAATDALANVGVHEDGPPYNNRGKAVDQYLASVGLAFGAGEPGAAWCSAFVNFRLEAAAKELGLTLPSTLPSPRDRAAANAWAEWAKDTGNWLSGRAWHVRKGDLALFDIASEGGIHHVGFVLDVSADGFLSVEGNTHPDGVPSRDGYLVALRHRSWESLGARGGIARLPL